MIFQVLHITPHIGGGVGSVIIDWLNSVSRTSNFKHVLACLDSCNLPSKSNLHPEKYIFYEGLYFKDREMLHDLILNSDLVLVHYWNHPLLSRLLVEEGLPNSRVICWCHNSGLHEPSIIPNYLVDFVDTLVFTSAVSLKVDNLKANIQKYKSKFQSIHSSRDFTDFLVVYSRRNHKLKAKNLIYVGTVSYDKLHADSALMFNELAKCGFNLTIVGGPNHDHLKQQYFANNSCVTFTGPVDCVLKYLEAADIFIYPLRSDHYGTGEQCLLEAMATGLPVVAFSNDAESLIITNDKNGYLADSTDHFLQRILELSDSFSDRERISAEATFHIETNFSSNAINHQFESLFYSLMETPKRRRFVHFPCISKSPLLFSLALNSVKANSYVEDLFLRSNNDSQIMLGLADYISGEIKKGHTSWTSSSKGTPAHYLSYFPDELLKAFVSIL